MPLDFERDGVAISAGVVGADILQRLAEEFEEAGMRVGAYRRRRMLHVDYCWSELPKELEWALAV